MFGYLIAAFVLLLTMLYLVLRPWLLATEPALDGSVELTDTAATARSVARVERVSRPMATGPSADPAPSAGTEPAPAAAPASESAIDLRASVEAAIAARKAALKARRCTACAAVVEDGDAFCRSCGTKVPE